MQVLVVKSPGHTLPDGTSALIEDCGWDTAEAADYAEALIHAGSGKIDAVIMSLPAAPQGAEPPDGELHGLLQMMNANKIAGVILADGDGHRCPAPGSLIEVVDPGVSLAEIRGRFAMIDRYHSQLRTVEAELGRMESITRRLAQHFNEVDEEMSLAGRLQRDFLPMLDKPIGSAQFESVYHPASWVSGDVLDVLRIDEDHTGFYIADAVGHGMAAGLPTMFIRRTLSTAHTSSGNDPQAIPSRAMAQLNEALLSQNLPQCQFVTGWYGVLNNRTLVLHYAHGGHPHPFLISSDGSVCKIKARGSLLGVFPDGGFETTQTQLHPGNKLLLYTDGAELAFSGSTADIDPGGALRRLVESFAQQPIGSMLEHLILSLPSAASPHIPRDDISMLGLEILPE